MNTHEKELLRMMRLMNKGTQRGTPNTIRFVQKHGSFYEPLLKRPKGIRKGAAKACFLNGQRLAIQRQNLIYVEGYALLRAGVVLYHGWCIEEGVDKAIEVTSKKTWLAYLGIAFQTEYVARAFGKNCSPLIDDWEEDWPLLSSPAEELKEALLNPNE